MQASEETITKMVRIATELSFLKFAPANPAGYLGWAKGVLRFVADLDKAQWLVDDLAATCETFPSVVYAREVYTGVYPPADGGE